MLFILTKKNYFTILVNMRHLKATIYGRVQGVNFRFNTREKAEELNLSGWVANQTDGSVYLEAEGEEENLISFLDWCRQGSPVARVDRVDYKFSEDLRGFEGFEIR